MNLRRIDNGESEDVTIPEEIFLLRTVVNDNTLATVGEMVQPASVKWFDAVQQWALANGYEPPSEL